MANETKTQEDSKLLNRYLKTDPDIRSRYEEICGRNRGNPKEVSFAQSSGQAIDLGHLQKEVELRLANDLGEFYRQSMLSFPRPHNEHLSGLTQLHYPTGHLHHRGLKTNDGRFIFQVKKSGRRIWASSIALAADPSNSVKVQLDDQCQIIAEHSHEMILISGFSRADGSRMGLEAKITYQARHNVRGKDIALLVAIDEYGVPWLIKGLTQSEHSYWKYDIELSDGELQAFLKHLSFYKSTPGEKIEAFANEACKDGVLRAFWRVYVNLGYRMLRLKETLRRVYIEVRDN